MARQSRQSKATSDPELDRLIREAARLKAQSDEIIEKMNLLNAKIDDMAADRRASEKKKFSN
jgi:hypothetical protein